MSVTYAPMRRGLLAAFQRAPRSASVPSRSFGEEAAVPTALSDFHVSLGGKMVPFAGYSLPVLYETKELGVINEHMHCRADGSSSLFDVSHMGQIRWHGKDRVKFLESVLCGDFQALSEGEAKLSLITNPDGGIIDDTIVANAGDTHFMVVNGACKFGDMDHFDAQLKAFGGDVSYEYYDETQLSLVAVQGPGAQVSVQKLVPDGVDLAQVGFMVGFDTTLAGIEGCRLTRCGYTGEDGFELSVPSESAVALAEAILADKTVKPAGLGARDSLRLEAGLCLYGNDIDMTTTPIEAALGWTIGGPKSRRRQEQGFLGAEKFLSPEGKLKKTTRKRVGIIGMKAPARQGAEILDPETSEPIGVVTSGTMSPCLKKPIAMGYVASDYSKDTTKVAVKVRNKVHEAQVTKMPFVESRYYRGP